ncbi:microtubule-associated protein 9 isoform X2 [Nerophis lumbriciformis]|uniref:microtubule-associated protein 9 isoform X2 n=1 Tax=Nerophis lumbriciformis TaxID=546530 RepID=UPI002ADFEF8B|nr:microtubule-associated protein 9-like isoform X2 [Nerophis lumbriciformis]
MFAEMTNQLFETLAFTKSPKTTKRTTFQDELQSALSARARKTSSLLCPQDFEDGDDFMSLLKSRRNRSDAFKAAKSSSKINDFEFSDDEDKQGSKKRTSFLKSKGSPSLDEAQQETTDSCKLSSEDDSRPNDQTLGDHHRPTRNNSSVSLSYQSDDVRLDSPFRSKESPALIRPESRMDNSGDTIYRETSSDADFKSVSFGTEKETPTPKPRQRTVGLSLHATQITADAAECLLAMSRPPTSPLLEQDACIDIADAASPEQLATVRSCSPHLSDDGVGGRGADSRASNGITSADTTERQSAYFASLEAFNESADPSITPVQVKASDTRASSSQSKRVTSVGSKKVESKYLGTLKVLDSKDLRDSQHQDADYLRAAVYQDWLKKKKELTVESTNREKILKEQKKKEEEEKRKDAAASYEAWKKKKDEIFKAKAKKEKNKMRKEQRVVQEVEEKRKTAEQVFDQWKRDHDKILRDKWRKQREAEKKHTLKKKEEEDERKRGSQSAFSTWCEEKYDALQKKASTARVETRYASEEHRYVREEKDKMAMEMFEQWLAKKDVQQKRQREERRVQVILRDSPPPPWSPPNNTIQFRK